MESPSNIPQQRPKQSCDNCRFRKTRCDRGLPCRGCVAASIPCQYLHTIRRTGPRKGRRLLQIKQGFKSLDKDHIEVTTVEQIQREMAACHDQATVTPTSTCSPSASCTSSSTSPVDPVQSRERLTFPLAANVQVFLKHMLPIMPVIDGAEVLSDALRFDELPLPRQALIMALCAATRIQLRLDFGEQREDIDADFCAAPNPQLTGEGMLATAKLLRRQFDVVDNMGLDAILTSFFLFAAHGNFEQHQHAVYYLNESLSLLIALGLDNEATYSDLDADERERRRRIFWLLFVTERTYALQRRRPVMLRSTVTKPKVVGSDQPVIMNDFINHIRLFETLPHSLYDWLPNDDSSQQPGSEVVLRQRVGERLCDVRAHDSMLESQSLDTLVTQQWLRVSMWRLTSALGNGHRPSHNLGLPFDAGKTIMSRLALASPESKDCHGISLEQKLFDIGISLADVSMAVVPISSFEFGSVDMLFAIVKCLGHIRGCQSHLLPRLLEHSEVVLACNSPAAQINMQWALCEGSPSTLPDSPDYTTTQPEDESGSPGSTQVCQETCSVTNFGSEWVYDKPM